jgi:hypothetical protein
MWPPRNALLHPSSSCPSKRSTISNLLTSDFRLTGGRAKNMDADPMMDEILDLLQGDTSSAGETILLIFVMMAAAVASFQIIAQAGRFLGRKYWVFPRQQTTWEVLHKQIWLQQDPQTRDRLWRRTYMMSYAIFQQLVEDLTPFIQKQRSRFREPIEVERAVAFTLYRLAHGDSPLEVGEKFGVSEAAVIQYFKAITKVLQQELCPQFIQIPSGPRLLEIIQRFKEETGFDNMVGAIDGSHIKLASKPPARCTPADYWCRHDIHSILLQGVCTVDNLFWDVCCLAPGGFHDAAPLRSSDLYNIMKRRGALQVPHVVFGNKTFTPFLVGDSAYPMLRWLLKPFTANRNGSPQQNDFDRDLRKGRVKIENTFGQLKGRWQILKNLNVGLEYGVQTIIACCVLHNYCIMKGKPLVPNADHLGNSTAPATIEVTETASNAEAKTIRDALFEDWKARQI